MKKIIFTFLIVITFIGFSQEENDYDKGFSIKAGVNAIDSSGEQSPFVAWGEFGDRMAFSRPFALGVDYRFSRLFSAGLMGSLNKWKEGQVFDDGILGDPTSFATLREVDYFAVDLDLKFYLSELLFDADWLDIYLLGGGSYFDEQADAIAPIGGFGGNIWLTDKLGVNAQAVGKFAGEEFTQSNHIQYFAGLTYKFIDNDADNDGIKDSKDECVNTPGVPELNGCPDTDGDGIKDSEDNCPNDPGTIENGGCPDRDGDGVIDKDDECPDSPGLAKLNGCPDRDGDGIADHIDDCPDQFGTVGKNGCLDTEEDDDNIDDDNTDDNNTGDDNTVDDYTTFEIGDYVTSAEGVGPIRFGFDQTFIKDKYKENLDKIINLIRGTTAVYSIEGHTDSIGSYTYNNGLSVKRAQAVKDYLVANGLPANMFVVVGKGEYNPEDPNDAAANRRVVIIRIE